jgi:hypothetical protein
MHRHGHVGFAGAIVHEERDNSGTSSILRLIWRPMSTQLFLWRVLATSRSWWMPPPALERIRYHAAQTQLAFGSNDTMQPIVNSRFWAPVPHRGFVVRAGGFGFLSRVPTISSWGIDAPSWGPRV